MTDEDSFAGGDVTAPAATPVPVPVPSLLCDVHALAAAPDTADTANTAATGAVWKLAESGRQLDANLVHLPAGRQVGTHTEPDLDVILLVVSGGGTLSSPGGPRQQLTAGSLYWLPHGSTRAVAAGEAGLSYLTVHRRRPGMQIRSHPRPENGAPNDSADGA